VFQISSDWAVLADQALTAFDDDRDDLIDLLSLDERNIF
jgi:hypothetical protein